MILGGSNKGALSDYFMLKLNEKTGAISMLKKFDNKNPESN